MDILTKPLEWDEAARRLSRTPVGAALNSEEWSQVPLALRERAFFTSRLENARAAGRLQDLVRGSASPGEFVANARKFILDNGLGRAPATVEDNASLTNLGSTRRLELIFNHNVKSAGEYAYWKQGQDPDTLDAFPAQELLRVEERDNERDWRARWQAAGGRLYQGRMIALKSDPIWMRISRFGTPWPPFDFESGMGIEDIDRDEAEALGVIGRDQPARSLERDFNADLSASVRGLAPEVISKLVQDLRDLNPRIQGGSIWIRGDRQSRRLAQPQRPNR